MYKCEFFTVWELVPPEMSRFEERHLWGIFDNRLLRVIDLLREFYGPIVINNWHNKGEYKDSGLRTFFSSYYSSTSQHSYAKAVDAKPTKTSVDKIRNDILKQKFPWMSKIKGLELEVSWLHIDTRNSKELITFKP